MFHLFDYLIQLLNYKFVFEITLFNF